jgi:hypothetical protein
MLLHWDGFDHYGSATANLLLGNYQQVQSRDLSLTSSNPATGTRALRFPTRLRGNMTIPISGIRKVLPQQALVVGAGFRLRMDQIPSVDDQSSFFAFRTQANANSITLGIQADGSFFVNRGGIGGTRIADSGAFNITAGGYRHIETRVEHSATTGTVEMRVDGITRISETGLNTGATATGQIMIGSQFSGDTAISDTIFCQIDDFFCWDDTGSLNNDFLGPKVVLWVPPTADTLQADWTSTAGTGYGAIDGNAPDGDASYIFSGTPNDISTFELGSLPPEVYAISGVSLFGVSRKTDSGDASVQLSFESNGSETAGGDNPLSEAYTYLYDNFEIDPATGSPMTPANFNTYAQIKIERTI